MSQLNAIKEYLKNSKVTIQKDGFSWTLNQGHKDELIKVIERPTMDMETLEFIVNELANNATICFVPEPTEDCKVSSCKECLTKWMAPIVGIEVE